MSKSDLITIFFSILGIAIGVIFGVFINKIIFSDGKSKWKWAFYILGIIIILSSLVFAISCWGTLIASSTLIVSSVLSFLSGFGIIILTKNILDKKEQFNTSELDEIVNNFTAAADRNEIKLFGGDLNFFGETPREIDQNLQYTFLRSMQFKRVLIICETPNDTTIKVRYGKLISEIPGLVLAFYDPENADLRVRGRIIEIGGSIRLLMYKKIKSKTYQPIRTDTSDSTGALYNNIWNLVWGLAINPSMEDLKSYVELFKTSIR